MFRTLHETIFLLFKPWFLSQFQGLAESDLQILFHLGFKCNVEQIRTNAISIVSLMGNSLSKQERVHPLLQVGNLAVCIRVCVEQVCALFTKNLNVACISEVEMLQVQCENVSSAPVGRVLR